jgi:N-acetylglucosaminyldiphosphoundecaprenol N-acetyl-beta-D-mannosaminyltransferase
VGTAFGKQEKFIDEYKYDFGAKLIMGVGGSFDTLAGRTKRAPRWVRSIGFEWLYRLFKDPKRWRRQLALPHFALTAVKERIIKGDISG